MKSKLLFLFLLTIPYLYSQNSTVYPKIYDDDYIKNFIENLPNDSNSVKTIMPNINNRSGSLTHFPYPVIFVHGLYGSADSWTKFYKFALESNWSYGGWLDFCLNADGNNAYSNIYTAPLENEIKSFTGQITPADFYLINFNEDASGSAYKNAKYPVTCNLSNQAAIVKQAIALRNAIEKVLAVTGKDKVILFGHSMGGLAIRQYIQNESFWQIDKKHHVAKVVTCSTPHGGSNFDLPSFVSKLSNDFKYLDKKSDAVRDLRYSYFYSFDPGVFLFGGLETAATMNDYALESYYNFDVDCNGKNGENIIGLNNKKLPRDLEFTCITGQKEHYIGDNGDDIVDLEKQRIKTYYKDLQNSETFALTSEIFPLHMEMPSFVDVNITALDEPDIFEWAYEIDLNTYYNGYITFQAPDAKFVQDYDDYIFYAPKGILIVDIENMPATSFYVNIYKKNYQLLKKSLISGNKSVLFDLPSDDYYYLEFESIGATQDWKNPYTFKVIPEYALKNEDNLDKINIIVPNPTSGILNVISSESIDNVEITDIIGQASRLKLDSNVLDITNLQNGVYFIKFNTINGKSTIKKIVKI